MGFFHAIDWKEPWLMGLLGFHVVLVPSVSTPNCDKLYNFPWALHCCQRGRLVSLLLVPFLWFAYNESYKCDKRFLLPYYTPIWELSSVIIITVAGVYFAERLNKVLAANWRSFATQNYFDPYGVFLSAHWSGPLLAIAMIILISTLFSLCHLIVRWKRAELRPRAMLARNKQD